MYRYTPGRDEKGAQEIDCKGVGVAPLGQSSAQGIDFTWS